MPSGKLVEFIGTVMDVTEQKRAEEERRAHLVVPREHGPDHRAMQLTNDVEGMMSGVLEEDAGHFRFRSRLAGVSLRFRCGHVSRGDGSTRVPNIPGAFVARREEFPADTQGAELLRRVLDGPGPATDLRVPAEIRERFSIQSMIAIAVRSQGGPAVPVRLHQCSHARAWTARERRLFEEIARRLEDALTSVLAHRNLLASEEELRRSQYYLAEAQKTQPDVKLGMES